MERRKKVYGIEFIFNFLGGFVLQFIDFSSDTSNTSTRVLCAAPLGT